MAKSSPDHGARCDLQPEGSVSRDLSLGEKWFVITNLGLATWLARSKNTSAGILCTSFALTSIVSTVAFIPLGLSYMAAAVVFALALTVGLIGHVALRQESVEVRNSRRTAALGALGAPFLIAVILNVDLARKPPIALIDQSHPSASRNIDLDSPNFGTDCYAAGQALASTYLANISTLARADVMPSEVRDSGCSRIADRSSNAALCIDQCTRAFASSAKAVVK